MFAFEAVQFLRDAEDGVVTSHNTIMLSLPSWAFDFLWVQLPYETELQQTRT